MLSGCAGGKIFEPYDADKTSVSMDARQRVILSVDRVGPDGVKRRIVCAEPSPDTIAAAAASAGLSGGVSGIPEAPTLAADVAGNAARSEQAAYIGARNATIQLLRDGLYRACEAYMNGALGDFGYGLVLSNYGRVMTALLSAEGLTRPALAPPVIIGSVSGPGSTNVNQQGGSRPAGTTASGTTPAAGTADTSLGTVTGGSGSAATTSGGGTALQAIGEPTNGSVTGINDQAAEVFEKVILPLASPSSTPDGSFVEAAMGCMLWRDRTGLKEGTLAPGDPLAAMCDTIMTNMPRLAEDAVRMKMQIAQDQAKAEAVAVREEKVVARESPGGCSPWRWCWRGPRGRRRRGRPAWTGRPCATGCTATTPKASPASATPVGRRPRLTAEQEAELVTAVERADPDRDRVVRWRRVACKP